MFGVNCRSPTEAAFSPIAEPTPVSVADYRQELVLSLSSAQELAQRNTSGKCRRNKGPNMTRRQWSLTTRLVSGFSFGSRKTNAAATGSSRGRGTFHTGSWTLISLSQRSTSPLKGPSAFTRLVSASVHLIFWRDITGMDADVRDLADLHDGWNGCWRAPWI